MSKKLDQSLIDAYVSIYEAKRGHAAGSSDSEKQASQLASDVRYKAKGKLKPGVSEEEKKKIFLQILNASPASGPVKAMAKQKLLGEDVVVEDKKMSKQSDEALAAAHEKFSKMDQSMPSNKFMLARIKKEQKKRKKVTESTKAKKFLDDKAKKLQKEYDSQSKEKKNNPAFQSNRLNPKPQYNSYKPEGELVDEMSKSTTEKPKEKKMTPNLLKQIRKVDTQAGSQYEQVMNEFKMTPKKNKKSGKSMDPVGQEDGDINNDGKKDGTDKYLANRRKAIGKAIAKKRGRVKEGFSAWRIDLDFNEQVKK